MKHFGGLVPFVLCGLSAATSFAVVEEPSTPIIRRDAPLFAGAGYASPDEVPSRRGLHQDEKHQTDVANLELTPAHLAELLSQLRLVYGQISAFAATQDTGLLNNLLRLLGGVVPPLSDVLETLRSILIGDSVTILEQLAACVL
ncbi:hypothetical protein F5144DRAFT_597308 [Chaetomium tenue]|uniref:Uncharacterized protein n=1 Tax=Chaetomium tenue TaxID=1854479 RepID=A0ACB7PLX5_9PEZI|nr:hypothetical protein F5144DRAFT_597308 [Chaetomium globosum]